MLSIKTLLLLTNSLVGLEMSEVPGIGPKYDIDLGLSTRPTLKLLPKITGKGLDIEYSFPRTPALAAGAVNISLIIENGSENLITDIEITDVEKTGVELDPFMKIPSLGIGAISQVNIGIDFKDTLQPAKFSVCCNLGKFPCKIQPNVGELLTPFVMDESDFNNEKGKLSGMHENRGSLDNPSLSIHTISQRVSDTASMSLCFSSDSNTLKFSSKTISKGQVLLLTVDVAGTITVTVNSESVVFGSMILKNMTAAFLCCKT